MADNKNIVGAYVGTEEVSKIYLGTDLLYDSTPTPPVTTNKTLVIMDVEDGIQGGQDRGCGIGNIFDFFSTWNDAEEQVNNSLEVYPPFSGSYERHDSTNTITLVGPFTASSYTLNCYGPIDTCTNILNDIDFQFSGDTAEVYCDYTPPEPDLECECVSNGGEWDSENQECTYPEPDPCAEYGSQEECDCVQNGGTWDSENQECIYPAPDYTQMPFTIEALGSGDIKLRLWSTSQTISRSFYVSVNGGPETEYTISNTGNTALTISVVSGDIVSYRASQQQNGVADGALKRMYFDDCTTNYNAYGNILSLSYPDFENKTTMPNAWQVYYGLFYFSDELISAENLVLPSNATNFCYSYMFYNCRNLTTAPVLPAASLKNSSYANMFQGCSSLTYIKCLATDISASNCLKNWVDGVSATGTFVKDANATWPSGANGIPNDWTVVNA